MIIELEIGERLRGWLDRLVSNSNPESGNAGLPRWRGKAREWEYWTEAEDVYLRSASKVSMAEKSKHLGRSQSAIMNRLRRLKIQAMEAYKQP